MTRKEYFKKHISYTKLLDHYRMYDFVEFVVNRYGDINVYRVYGHDKNSYKLVER